MATRPDTCLRCRGRKWRPADGGVVLRYFRCPRCKGSGCRRAETLAPEFFELPAHPGLLTGPIPIDGEIENAR
jgi:hypothetical protein